MTAIPSRLTDDHYHAYLNQAKALDADRAVASVHAMRPIAEEFARNLLAVQAGTRTHTRLLLIDGVPSALYDPPASRKAV